MSTYIKPPESSDCTWRDGPPPEIGWWPASETLNPSLLRYWDGGQWSMHAASGETAEGAAQFARHPCFDPDPIKWTDRWWLSADAIDAQRYRKLRRALFFQDVLVQPHNEATITMRVSGACPSEDDIDATIDALPEVKA